MRGVKSIELNIVRVFLFLAGASFLPATQSGDLRLDHTIIAVNNIDAASRTFSNLGFKVKPGKQHKNGLINLFIKLSDKTEIELMSLAATPKDSIAKIYADFLDIEEGGIYVALSGIDIQTASTLMQSSEIEHKIKPGKLWNYIVFPEGSGLEHIFLIDMHYDDRVHSEFQSHENRITGLSQIWLQSNDEVRNLLHTLGATKCKAQNTFKISDTLFTLIGQTNNFTRPKFVGLGFSGGNKLFVEPKYVHGVWLRSSSSSTCAPNS